MSGEGSQYGFDGFVHLVGVSEIDFEVFHTQHLFNQVVHVSKFFCILFWKVTSVLLLI